MAEFAAAGAHNCSGLILGSLSLSGNSKPRSAYEGVRGASTKITSTSAASALPKISIFFSKSRKGKSSATTSMPVSFVNAWKAGVSAGTAQFPMSTLILGCDCAVAVPRQLISTAAEVNILTNNLFSFISSLLVVQKWSEKFHEKVFKHFKSIKTFAQTFL